LRGGKGGIFMVGPGWHFASLRHCADLYSMVYETAKAL